MVRIVIINNVRSKIEGDLSTSIRNKLDQELSYFVDGYFFSKKFKIKKWDGRVRLFSKINQSFQSGCFFLIAKILTDFQIPFELDDRRKIIKPQDPLPIYGKEARDYQAKAVEVLMKRTRGVLIAATGAGKTFIVGNLVARLNLPTMIYVHTCDLLHQMKDEIESLLQIKCGQMGDGCIDIRQINVATIQTASRALLGEYEKAGEEDNADDEYTNIAPYRERIVETIKKCNVVIIDETHHASASSIQAVMKASEDAYYRYGVTATLREKGDDLLVNAVIGRVIHTIRASELIRAGWLIRPTIYFYEVDYTLVQQQGTYQQVYKNCIVENEYRNKLVVDSAIRFYESNKKILILVKRIKHGNILMEYLYDRMKVRFLQSKVNSEDRKQILEDFRNGDLDCIIATSLADEGLDLPILDAVILAGSGMSKVKAMQRIGRAIRKYPGKEKAYIVDFNDKARYLQKHSAGRLKVYKSEEEFQIKIQKKP